MISDVYFPRVNGVSTSIQIFRRDLAALGCESWLVAPSYPGARDAEPGVLRQPSRYLVFDPEDRMMIGRAALAACLELREQRRSRPHPDAVHRASHRSQGRSRARSQDARDLPHVLRRVSASLPSADSARRHSRIRARRFAPAMQLRGRRSRAVAAARRRARRVRCHRSDRGDPDGARFRRFRRRRWREVPRTARDRAAASRDVARGARRAREEHPLSRARARRGTQVGARRAVRDRRGGPGAARA